MHYSLQCVLPGLPIPGKPPCYVAWSGTLSRSLPGARAAIEMPSELAKSLGLASGAQVVMQPLLPPSAMPPPAVSVQVREDARSPRFLHGLDSSRLATSDLEDPRSDSFTNRYLTCRWSLWLRVIGRLLN